MSHYIRGHNFVIEKLLIVQHLIYMILRPLGNSETCAIVRSVVDQ